MMKKIVLSLIVIVLTTLGHSQVQDAELWTGLGLKAKVGRNLSFKYETQTRFNKNASALKTYYNELSGEYELVKNLTVGLAYRYSRRNKESHYTGDNRLCLNLEYSQKITDLGFKLKARARYQYGFDRIRPINDLIFPSIDQVFRLKLELKYKNDAFKRLLPYVGYEFFKDINPSSINGINAFRIYGGMDFDLPARHELGVKYIYEREFGKVQKINHIYMFEYNYNLSSKLFDKKKKKKKK